jgi:hypothetical protein
MLFLVSLMIDILTWMRWYPNAILICIFLRAKKVECFLMYLSIMWISSFENCSAHLPIYWVDY